MTTPSSFSSPFSHQEEEVEHNPHSSFPREVFLHKDRVLLQKDEEEIKCNLHPPDYINPSQAGDYAEGFILYTQCASLNMEHIVIEDLTENIIYFMAVAAYVHRDVEPLRHLGVHLNELDSHFFWLYLANEDCFYITLETEMYRRHTLTSLLLKTITEDSE